MAQAKVSDAIVVHEILAFLQNKLDVMDELSLEQICMSSYKEEEIKFSRKSRDGRGKRDLQDIFRVFNKETDPDDVPTYGARTRVSCHLLLLTGKKSRCYVVPTLRQRHRHHCAM